jgi:hypothetical protein
MYLTSCVCICCFTKRNFKRRKIASHLDCIKSIVKTHHAAILKQGRHTTLVMVLSCNGTSFNDSCDFLLTSIIALLTPEDLRARMCCKAVRLVGIVDKSTKRNEWFHQAANYKLKTVRFSS